MKLNKKSFFIIPIVLALIIFVGLFVYYNIEDDNTFTASEKNWIEKNINIRYDFEKVSNYPIYTNVIDDFIDSFEKTTGLELNIINYNKNKTSSTDKLSFKVVKNKTNLSDSDVVLNEDYYVAISTKEMKINKISDFKNFTIGVFSDDSADISYYLKNGSNLTYKSFKEIDKMLSELEEENLDMVIIPNIMYLEQTIGKSNYVINYVLTDMSNKLVLSLNSDEDELNNIINKYFIKWKNETFANVYNEELLNYYVSYNNINSKTKQDVQSKTYVYGFVENYPYEVLIKNQLEGITGEYINRIQRLTGINFEYKKYKNLNELNKAVENKEVDLFFNYYGIDNTNYYKTVSTFIERYVVLGKTNDYHVINSFEGLKGNTVSILDDNALYNYFKDNSKANLEKYNSIKDMVKNSDDNLLIVDYEIYNYYRNDKFKNYEVLYQDIMMNDYYFMINNVDSDFYKLFDYIINTNSYFNYRNNGLNSLNVSILDGASFNELYIFLLIIVVVPVLLFMIFVMFIKKKHNIKIVRKEERKKYTDLLTSLKNRNYLNFNLNNWNKSKIYPQTIIIIDLNNVKYVNDNYGYEQGDKLIVKAASLLVNTQLEKSEIMRTDGNEFLIYLVGYSEHQIATYTKKLSKELKELPHGFGAAIGYSMIVDDIKTIEDAINEATIDMRNDKEEYK